MIFHALYNIIWFLIIAGVNCAQLVPKKSFSDSFLSVANSMPTKSTSLSHIFSENSISSKMMERAMEKTFNFISDFDGNKSDISSEDMLHFINETSKDIREDANGADGVFAGQYPSNGQLKEISNIQLNLIEGSEGDGNVTLDEFKSYVNATMHQNFTYFPAVCDAVTMSTEKCFVLSKESKDLRKVRKHVQDRISIARNLCKIGISALGGYRVENCVMEISDMSSHSDTSESVRDREVNCFQQYQCFYGPEEKPHNPWNATIPEIAKVPLSLPNSGTRSPSSYMSSFGTKALISEYINQLLMTEKKSWTIRRRLLAAGFAAGSLGVLAVFCPPCFVGATATFGVIEWTSALIAADLMTDLVIPRDRIIDSKDTRKVVEELNIIAN